MRWINTLWHICCNCFPHNELTWSSHRWICIWMCICSNWLLGRHYYCINITNDTMCVEICSRWFVLQVICNTSFVSYRKIDVLKCNVTHRVQWFDQWWETSNQPHKSSSFLVFFLEIAPIYVAWQMCPTTSVLNEPRTKKRFPEYAKKKQDYRLGEKVERQETPLFASCGPSELVGQHFAASGQPGRADQWPLLALSAISLSVLSVSCTWLPANGKLETTKNTQCKLVTIRYK